MVNTGTSRYTFSGIVNSSLMNTTNYVIGVRESYMYNGYVNSVIASTNLVVLDPLQITTYGISGGISGTCTQNAQNTINPNDYNCSITGTPNSSGTIKWFFNNHGQSMCLTWQLINPVLQSFADKPYTDCTTSNGASGAVIPTGQFSLWFTIAVPNNAQSTTNNIEFMFQ